MAKKEQPTVFNFRLIANGFYFYWILLFVFNTHTYAQSCKIKPDLSKKSFAINYPKKTAKINQIYKNTIQIKAPKKGRDINQFNNISCNKFIPNFGNVVSVTITKIKNLPPGIRWTTNKTQNRFTKSDTGCLFLKGKPRKKGDFPLQINVLGVGSFLGIKKTVKCTVRGYRIQVK